MISSYQSRNRPAAVTLENAIVLPVLLFFLLAILTGGMGVFRYQQVASQARELCRWACLRGSDYQSDTGQVSPTQAQIREQVYPLLAGMDPDSLSVKVEWIDKAANTVHDWDEVSRNVKSVNLSGEQVTNAVRVTITYSWSPGWYFGSLHLKSVMERPMSF